MFLADIVLRATVGTTPPDTERLTLERVIDAWGY